MSQSQSASQCSSTSLARLPKPIWESLYSGSISLSFSITISASAFACSVNLTWLKSREVHGILSIQSLLLLHQTVGSTYKKKEFSRVNDWHGNFEMKAPLNPPEGGLFPNVRRKCLSPPCYIFFFRFLDQGFLSVHYTPCLQTPEDRETGRKI